MQIGGLMIEQESASALRKVHFILNSKGGVGKSFIAFLLAQYYRQLGEPALCFDADATTATFSSFAALDVTRILLMDEGRVLNTRRFDAVLEPVLVEDANAVVDTGTSSFVALSHYLIENDVHAQIRDAGKQVVVHAIIIGAGRTLAETLSDLDDLATQLPEEVQIIVWLNEHFGLIKQDGKDFERMKAYETHRERIAGIVHLPHAHRRHLRRGRQGDDPAAADLRRGHRLARIHPALQAAAQDDGARRLSEAGGGAVNAEDGDGYDVRGFIGEVARRHNILLDERDPLFIQLTLVERIVVRSVERVREAVLAAENEIAAGSILHREAAKAVAGQIITGSAEYVARAIQVAGGDAAAMVKAAAARELEAARAASNAAQAAHRAVLWAASVIVAAACIATAASLAIWFGFY